MSSEHPVLPPDSEKPTVAAPLDGCLALFEAGTDRNALDRALLALATHPRGPGFARAHLLLWEPALQCFEGRLVWRPGTDAPLGEALAGALRQASLGTDVDATRALRGLPLDPDRLEPVLDHAWRGSGVADGSPDPRSGRAWCAAPRIGVMRIRRGAAPYALVVGEWESEPDEYAIRRLVEWRTLAEAALVHLERADLLERRAGHATALARVAGGLSGASHLSEVLHAVVTAAHEGCRARGAALWRPDASGTLRLDQAAGTHGPRERIGRGLTALAAAVFEEGCALVLDAAGERTELSAEIAASVNAVALVPIPGAPQGAVLGIWDRVAFHPAESGGFDALDRSFLDTLVRLASGLLDRARQDEGVRTLQRERQDLERQLRRLERAHASAELTSQALREARNPVASIAAFARRAQKEQPESESAGDYLHVIVRESERLERWLENAARASAPEPGGMVMTEINPLIQEALQGAGERLVRRRVRLLKRLAADLPALLLDRERVQRAVTNVLEQALDAVGVGGRIRVESRRAGTHVVVEIAHDGHAGTGERFEQLLATFAAGRTPGSLGLALAQRVVQEHGGEVRVRGEGEWGAILTLSLPVRDNGDRRRESADRRATHADRRRRTPAG